mgnify:FL=1
MTPAMYRDKSLKRDYGITLDQYNSMLTSQSGVCAACKGPPGGKGTYHVDHDHRTGKIRGLLCHNCNASLGMVNDDASRLRLLIRYLKKYS